MGSNDGGSVFPDNHSDTEVVGVDRIEFSGPLTGPLNKRDGGKNVRFNVADGTSVSDNNGNDDYAEIIRDDSMAVKTLTAKRLEKTSSIIQQVSEELKRLTSSSKRQPVGRLDRTKSAATNALKGVKFISGGGAWAAVEVRFDELTKETNGLLPRSLFGACIDSKEYLAFQKKKQDSKDSHHVVVKDSKDFAGELFDSLSRRRNITGDSINKAQLKEFWDQIADQSFDSRLQTFFDMVDKNGDGRLTKDEVTEIISLSASANHLKNIQKEAPKYAALIMEELDPDNLGFIMIENLKKFMLQAPTLTATGESRNFRKLLSQKPESTQHKSRVIRWYVDFKYFLQDNWERCWVMVVWIGVMAGLFTWKYIQYKHRAAYDVMGSCVCIAKGSAETLKLNMAIILLPVCRNTITWLRNKTRLGAVVPFDDNINFHLTVAVAIAIGAGLHAISHLACDFPRLIHATEEEYKPMQQFFGDQAKDYWHFLKEVEGYTGIIMVVLMTIAFTLATPWLRRGNSNLPSFLKKLTGFNAFWYSHHLFVIVYAMLIVHGIKLYLTKEWYKKTTWMYLAVPLSLYACERLIRAFRSNVKKVKILKAVLPENVLVLQMSKPPGFKYSSGQYIFVKCSAVSPFEWHPFSITSAPGDNYLSVHIRSAGDWTRQLRKVFSDVHKASSDEKSGITDSQGENPNYPKVSIDGPYGAPAQDYKEYDVVMLVGLGIGATPMISIVKDIVYNMKAKEEEESALENGSTLQKNKSGPASANNFRTKQAYFYWVTREQGSFDWFKDVTDDVAEMDKYGLIEMHNYCTSVYEEGDARSAFITMLQSLYHAKNGVDVVSGTRVKSHFAKPNWRNVYKRIADNHPHSRIGVFYCGLPALVKELKHLALDFSQTTSTKFEFHKENF